MADVITRIQALIAKAESSPYPAEAEAFMAKAQQLINDHAIDQARLNGADAGSVGHETFEMQGTYTKERALIWGAVAFANRCRVLTTSSRGRSTVHNLTLIGRASDREFVRLVAASLELQAIRRMNELDPAATLSTPVVQRRSFLRGFAREIADRLQRTGTSHVVVSPSASKALELASHAVDRYVDDHFTTMTSRPSAVRHDGLAYSRGRRAGASADVGSTRIGTPHRAIG